VSNSQLKQTSLEVGGAEIHVVAELARAARVKALGKLAPLPSKGTLELCLPECEKGLGSLINSPDSADLIADVRLQPQPLWPDDRGYFLEVQRYGQGLVADFPAISTQVSAVFNYPDTIKAFHYHQEHTDCWTPATGVLQVVLVDLRADSRTFGWRNTMFVGELRPWHILIPPGVAHGYKVIGPECAVLVYLTDRFYDPKDEGRIPYDDPGINYDWERQRQGGWAFPVMNGEPSI
jgi:dTDP-4-dehydrorhamnose 3,5-epimerase